MKIDVERLKSIVSIIEIYKKTKVGDEQSIMHLLTYIYDECADGKLLELFMRIDAIANERKQARETLLTQGLEYALHMMTAFAKGGIENFDRNYKLLFGTETMNLGGIIYIAKAYFPEGTAAGASELGQYFFDKFLNIIVNNEEYFTKGDGLNWAEWIGCDDYIRLALEKNKKEQIG